MIDKELLSNILNVDVYTFYWVDIERKKDICVEWNDDLGIMSESYNIYELAHKGKEWAKREGENIFSTLIVNCEEAIAIVNLDSDYEQGFLAASEPDAIFKACKWIMSEQKRLSEEK